jgi:hypothetical protein
MVERQKNYMVGPFASYQETLTRLNLSLESLPVVEENQAASIT